MAKIPVSKYPNQAGYTQFDTDRNIIETMSDGIFKSMNTPESWVNVKDFGAKGDGTTDDTLAFQNALSTTQPHTFVYIPEGTYKITSTLDTNNHNIIGASTNKTTLNFYGCNGIRITNNGITVKNLTLKGDNETSGTGTANTKGLFYDTGNIANLLLQDLTIWSFGDSGLYFKSGLQNYIEKIVFYDNGNNTTDPVGGASLKIVKNGTAVMTTSIFKDIYARRGGLNSFYIDGGVWLTFENFICEYHTNIGQTVNCKNSVFMNIYAEANSNNVVNLDESYITQINTMGTWTYTYTNLGFDLRYHTEITPHRVKTKEIISDKSVIFNNLPTTDPHIVGQVWNSSGTLKVSAG